MLVQHGALARFVWRGAATNLEIADLDLVLLDLVERLVELRLEFDLIQSPHQMSPRAAERSGKNNHFQEHTGMQGAGK